MVTQLLTLDEVAARLGCAVDGREPAGVWSATPACPVWAGTAVGRDEQLDAFITAEIERAGGYSCRRGGAAVAGRGLPD